MLIVVRTLNLLVANQHLQCKLPISDLFLETPLTSYNSRVRLPARHRRWRYLGPPQPKPLLCRRTLLKLHRKCTRLHPPSPSNNCRHQDPHYRLHQGLRTGRENCPSHRGERVVDRDESGGREIDVKRARAEDMEKERLEAGG